MKLRKPAAMLLQRAVADQLAAERLLADAGVDDEIIGFHCQQAVEKFLKAWLAQLGVNYPKTHNLQTLLELLELEGQRLPPELSAIDLLTPYATLYRYEEPEPGHRFDRQAACALVRSIRAFVEGALGKSAGS
jgi:HEPN domain-containing protein